MKEAAVPSVPSPEKPALAERERAARLESLAQRLLDPDGLDRKTLSETEHLTAHEK